MGNGSDHMDNNKVTNKPCDTCCTNIQRTLNRDDVTCFEDCYAFHEWRNRRLDASYIGPHGVDRVIGNGHTAIGRPVTLAKRYQSASGRLVPLGCLTKETA